MNVAIFTDNDFDKVNGVTTALSAALQFASPGMRLRIYTAADLSVDSPHYMALRSFGVPIPFDRETRLYWPRLRAYEARARAEHIDLVHLTTPGPIGLAALYVARRLRVPLVGSFHTDFAACASLLSGSARLGALMRAYLHWLYGNCGRLLVPSEDTKRLLSGRGADTGSIDVWPCGVDNTVFSPDKRSARLRAQWHVSERRPALMYVGRLSREKGVGLLPKLHNCLHGLKLEHRFVIVGDGPMLDTLRDELPDAVFTGVLPRQDVAEVFASADLFVFPSRTDTAGNVVLEAQASGVPVLVTNAGGPREQMVDGVTGVVCKDDSPLHWTQEIGRVLRYGHHAEMRQAARAHALTRRWDEALQPLYRAYAEACPLADGPTPTVVPLVSAKGYGATAS